VPQLNRKGGAQRGAVVAGQGLLERCRQVLGRQEANDRIAIVGDRCERTGGKRTVAAELGEKGPLAVKHAPAWGMFDAAERLAGRIISGKALDGQRALANLRDHLVDREFVDDIRLLAEALDCCGSHHDRVEVADLVQPSRDVAAQFCERQVWTQRCELSPTPNRAGPDECTHVEVGKRRAHQHIVRVCSLRHCCEHK